MFRRSTSHAILPMPISLPPSPMPMVVVGGECAAAHSNSRCAGPVNEVISRPRMGVGDVEPGHHADGRVGMLGDTAAGGGEVVGTGGDEVVRRVGAQAAVVHVLLDQIAHGGEGGAHRGASCMT